MPRLEASSARRTGQRALVLCAAMLLTGPAARAQEVGGGCGNLKNAYGPLDYVSEHDKLSIVEPYHFPPEVEGLIRGKSGYLGGDIDYTLRASPNHHRALIAMMRYGERTRQDKPPNATYTVECYFKRAVAFQPKDAVSRMLYARFLHKAGRDAEAQQQLALALAAVDADDAFTYYNAGLIYVELKSYDKALDAAQRAYALGFPRRELRESLQKVGKWAEPPPGAASAALAAPDSPASSGESAR